MKLRGSHRKTAALTFLELLVIVSVLISLVAILLPTLAHNKRRGSYIDCINNVKQVGLSFRVWAMDNRDKFPMEISTANGGTSELAAKGDVIATFQIMSNELSTPKVLICPKDSGHTFATNFADGFSAKSISYFIGVDASTNLMRAFLSGDDHFLINGSPVGSGLINLASNNPIAWNASRHVAVGTCFWLFSTKTNFGNTGLSDGSVQQITSSGLTSLFGQTGLATNRLAIP